MSLPLAFDLAVSPARVLQPLGGGVLKLLLKSCGHTSGLSISMYDGGIEDGST